MPNYLRKITYTKQMYTKEYTELDINFYIHEIDQKLRSGILSMYLSGIDNKQITYAAACLKIALLEAGWEVEYCGKAHGRDSDTNFFIKVS